MLFEKKQKLNGLIAALQELDQLLEQEHKSVEYINPLWIANNVKDQNTATVLMDHIEICADTIFNDKDPLFDPVSHLHLKRFGYEVVSLTHSYPNWLKGVIVGKNFKLVYG